MNISIRPALVSDTEFARNVHHEAYRDVVMRQFGSWNPEFQDKVFDEEWKAKEFALVLSDGIPCGYVSLIEEPTRLFLHELVIHPEFQGRGIGTAILEQTFERARTLQVPVRLLTFHANRVAELYRRLGFREVGRTETQIEMEWTEY